MPLISYRILRTTSWIQPIQLYPATVWMKSLTMFSGILHLLHHHNRNFAHLLAFKHLVIEYLNTKIWAKTIKNEWLDTRPENLHTFEILWRISQVFIGPKVLVIGPFRFLCPNIYFRFCLIIWYKIYSYYLILNESIIFLSPNGKYEILWGGNSWT